MKMKSVFKKYILVLISLASIVAINACNANTQLPADITIITVKASEFKYDPPLLKFKQGQRIILVFKNNGAVIHDFIMRDRDFRVETKAAPGGNDVLIFTTPHPGSYKYICTVAGHEEAGMYGLLVVE